jgi:hypothetical protein
LTAEPPLCSLSLDSTSTQSNTSATPPLDSYPAQPPSSARIDSYMCVCTASPRHLTSYSLLPPISKSALSAPSTTTSERSSHPRWYKEHRYL